MGQLVQGPLRRTAEAVLGLRQAERLHARPHCRTNNGKSGKTRDHAVDFEGRNAFQLRRKTSTLAGPTSWRSTTRDATIIDVKTGPERPWHRVQVMIYQYALPLALPQYRNVGIGGEVIYPSHTVRIPRGALPGQFIEELASLIRRLAADALSRRVPTAQECSFCEVTAEDCPQRMEDGFESEDGTTDDF